MWDATGKNETRSSVRHRGRKEKDLHQSITMIAFRIIAKPWRVWSTPDFYLYTVGGSELLEKPVGWSPASRETYAHPVGQMTSCNELRRFYYVWK